VNFKPSKKLLAIAALSIVPMVHASAFKVDASLGRQSSLLDIVVTEDGTTDAVQRMGYGMGSTSVELGAERAITSLAKDVDLSLRAFFQFDDTRHSLVSLKSAMGAELKLAKHVSDNTSFGVSAGIASAKLQANIGDESVTGTVTMPKFGVFASHQIDDHWAVLLSANYAVSQSESVSSGDDSASGDFEFLTSHFGVSYAF
jgi:hypothetical protein